MISQEVLNMSKTVRVLDRHNKEIGVLKVSGSETVEALKKLVVKDVEAVRKRGIGIERVRL